MTILFLIIEYKTKRKHLFLIIIGIDNVINFRIWKRKLYFILEMDRIEKLV